MTTRQVYNIGQQPKVSGVFTDDAGNPATPTAVTVIVRKPDGTETTYTSPHSTIVLGTTTTFQFPSGLDQAGTWTVSMRGTGGALTRNEIEFTVRTTKLTNP